MEDTLTMVIVDEQWMIAATEFLDVKLIMVIATTCGATAGDKTSGAVP